MRARLLARACVVGLLVSGAAEPRARAAPPKSAPEAVLKAQYLERFTRFVEWPATSFASSQAPFLLCLAGWSELSAELEQLAVRIRLKGRTTLVRKLGDRAPGDLADCHLLYLAGSVDQSLEEILSRTRDRPILTVADTPGFGQRGVIINMHNSAGFVRFDINGSAARESHLAISSQLMRLARPEDRARR